jgi:hypothetical protein
MICSVASRARRETSASMAALDLKNGNIALRVFVKYGTRIRAGE